MADSENNVYEQPNQGVILPTKKKSPQIMRYLICGGVLVGLLFAALIGLYVLYFTYDPHVSSVIPVIT